MAVEARTRPTIRRHRTEDHRLPLPTRHKQMEQDRTPALLSHYRQLAWPAAGELPNRRQPYRQHHNLDRPRRRMRARPEHLPDKDQAHQAAEERDTHQTTRVPRGMELYHPTAMRTGCFIPAPKVYNRLLVPLTAADQSQAPPELRAAPTTITQHVDHYAAQARLPAPPGNPETCLNHEEPGDQRSLGRTRGPDSARGEQEPRCTPLSGRSAKPRSNASNTPDGKSPESGDRRSPRRPL